MATAAFSSPRSLANQHPRKAKLVAICATLLLISMVTNPAQSRSLSHEIDNRNSEIDPSWYVIRGVRPIGRFGKRQMKTGGSSLRPTLNILDLMLSARREQDTFNSNQQAGGEDTY